MHRLQKGGEAVEQELMRFPAGQVAWGRDGHLVAGPRHLTLQQGAEQVVQVREVPVDDGTGHAGSLSDSLHGQGVETVVDSKLRGGVA